MILLFVLLLFCCTSCFITVLSSVFPSPLWMCVWFVLFYATHPLTTPTCTCYHLPAHLQHFSHTMFSLLPCPGPSLCCFAFVWILFWFLLTIAMPRFFGGHLLSLFTFRFLPCLAFVTFFLTLVCLCLLTLLSPLGISFCSLLFEISLNQILVNICFVFCLCCKFDFY